jgi:predicted nucleotidyltransferase
LLQGSSITVNVRVWTIDREAILNRLRTWAQALAAEGNIAAVILFGSLARGDCTAQSDADVVVLLYQDDRPFHERLLNGSPDDIGLGVDVFPYTLAEARRSVAEGWGVMRPALADGVVLFERDRVLDGLRSVHGHQAA